MPTGRGCFLSVMIEGTEATVTSSQLCGLHKDDPVQGEPWSVVRLSKHGQNGKEGVTVMEPRQLLDVD